MSDLTPEEFYATLLPSSGPYVLEIRRAAPGDGKSFYRWRFVEPGKPAPPLDDQHQYAVSVCFHTPPARGKSTTTTTAAGARVLRVDMDDMTPDEAQRRIALVGLPAASRVVNSGRFAHLYWDLEEIYLFDTAEKKEAFHDALGRLTALLGGDPQAVDLARVLRVVGSYSLKDPANPRRCAVVRASGTRVFFEQFSALLEPLNALKRLWVSPRRHALSLALPGWLRRNQMGDAASCTALLEELYGEPLDPATRDAVNRAWTLPESDVAFKPHFEAAFADARWLVDFFTGEFHAAKRRVVSARTEASRAAIALATAGPVEHADGARDFPIAENAVVRWSSRGLDLVYFSVDKKGQRVESFEKVVLGALRPIRRLDLDGDRLLEFEYEGEAVAAHLGDLVDRLVAEGRVANRRRVSDVVSVAFDGMAGAIERAHASYGVFAEDGRLAVCESPRPSKVEQAGLWDTVSVHVRREATAAEVRDYVSLLSFWHPYEALPVVGLSLIAPFAFALRSNGILVPYWFGYSTESNLGKSALARAFSEKLWGVPPTSGDAIESRYRLAALLDQGCLPVLVDEADSLGERIWPLLKEASERALATKKGTKDLGMVSYSSRAVPLLTGNQFLHSSEYKLKRVVVVRFDASARAARLLRRREVDRLIGSLQPIGYAMIRACLKEGLPEAELLRSVRKYEAEIEARLPAWVPRPRAQVWGVVFAGLKVFEIAAGRIGCTWSAPDPEAFVSDVILPAERTGRELTRLPVQQLLDFLVAYRAQHSRLDLAGQLEVQGDGTLFERHIITVGKRERPGWLITSAFLQIYNRAAAPSSCVASLAEACRQSAAALGWLADTLLDGHGKPKVQRLEHVGRQRAAFVPDALAEGDDDGSVSVRLDDLNPVQGREAEDGQGPAPAAVDEERPKAIIRELLQLIAAGNLHDGDVLAQFGNDGAARLKELLRGGRVIVGPEGVLELGRV